MAHTEDACKEFEMMWEYDQSYMKNPPTKKHNKKVYVKNDLNYESKNALKKKDQKEL